MVHCWFVAYSVLLVFILTFHVSFTLLLSYGNIVTAILLDPVNN